ncbi:MAG: PH domain-containing protein [Saprospiraceae bacterium]|nr:PH domain-containing protein [Saprospiraceae bacterium]
MSLNSTNFFATPRRQSPVAIILAVFKTLRVLIRQVLLPFILFVVLGRKGNNYGMYFIVFVSSISLISMVYSIVNYYRSYYYVVGKELIVISGIIGKKRLSIPFERIQSINFEQSIIHRIFGVRKFKIDTAGSGENELELSALEINHAEALRQLLLNNSLPSKLNTSNSELSINPSDNNILSLDIIDLLKAGLVENHLRSGGLIFVFLWWLYANLQEIGINAEDYVDRMPAVAYGAALFFMGILLFLMISLVISLARTILKYYNLHFIRTGKGFKISQGLLNTKVISALDHKIQTVAWSDNLLKKMIGIFDLKLKQASSKTVENKESIIIPGANYAHIRQVCRYLFPFEDPDTVSLDKVDPSYLRRSIVMSVVVFVPMMGLAVFYFNYASMAASVVFLVFLIAMSYLAYKKLGYGYTREILVLKGGAFGDKHVVTSIFKTQSIKITQNPFQRRRGLVNLSLYNASGSETIPYIEEQKANSMLDYFLYLVESDQRHWM